MTAETDFDIAPHPAVFGDKVLATIRNLIHPLAIQTILDPFAGTGRIHELRPRYTTMGIELEPEWADHKAYAALTWTKVGDIFDVLDDVKAGGFEWDACITSPCFGNRMADHHEAKDKSERNTYRHKLGRVLSENNAGMLQWGDQYRDFHARAWEAVTPMIRSYFVLNIKDHVRKGERMPVTRWHVETLMDLGWAPIQNEQIRARGNRYGENSDVRVDHESVILFERRP